MEDVTESENWLLRILRELVVSIPAFLLIYLGAFHRGPWRWLVDLQLDLFGGYYERYTSAACLFLAIGMMIGIHLALKRAGWNGRALIGALIASLFCRWTELPSWLSVPLLFGVVFVIFGLWDYLSKQMAGPRTNLDAADLETGFRPESRWLVIKGRALIDVPVIWAKGDKEESRAVCFVSEDWQLGKPIAVVLKPGTLTKKFPANSDPTEVKGMTLRMGVPGLTRTAFAKKGLAIADDAVHLEVGETPDRQDFAVFMILVASGVVGICLLLAGIRSMFLPNPIDMSSQGSETFQ